MHSFRIAFANIQNNSLCHYFFIKKHNINVCFCGYSQSNKLVSIYVMKLVCPLLSFFLNSAYSEVLGRAERNKFRVRCTSTIKINAFCTRFFVTLAMPKLLSLSNAT